MMDIVIPGVLAATVCALLVFAVAAVNSRRLAVAVTPCRAFEVAPVGRSEADIPDNCAARFVALLSSSSSRPWQSATVSRLADAELLLDRLENCGIAERELSAADDAGFVIRWR